MLLGLLHSHCLISNTIAERRGWRNVSRWPGITRWNDIWEYVIRLSLLNDKSLNEFISLLHVSFHV